MPKGQATPPQTAREITTAAVALIGDLTKLIGQLEGLANSAPVAAAQREFHGRESTPNPSHQLSRLTSREQQVLELLIQGISNRRIARTLGITEPTVKNHLHAIFLKLGVTDRTQAIARVLNPPHE